MRKMAMTVALVAAMAIPAATATASPGGHGVVAKACKAERAEMGKKEWRSLYGKHAMRSCRRDASVEAKNAAQECKAERSDLGRQGFDDLYGSNRNKHNSLGKCVSGKVRDEIDPDCDDETVDPDEGTDEGSIAARKGGDDADEVDEDEVDDDDECDAPDEDEDEDSDEDENEDD